MQIRYMSLLLFLLLSDVVCFADASARYVKEAVAHSLRLDVVFIGDVANDQVCTDEEHCQTVLPNPVFSAVCAQTCVYPLTQKNLFTSWLSHELASIDPSIAFNVSTPAELLEAWAAMSQCTKRHVLVVMAKDESLVAHLALLETLQTQADVTVFSQLNDGEWYQQSLVQGQAEPWLKLDYQSLTPALKRALQRMVNSQHRRLLSIKKLHLLGEADNALLYVLKPSVHERWFNQMLLLRQNEQNFIDENGDDVFTIDGRLINALAGDQLGMIKPALNEKFFLQHNGLQPLTQELLATRVLPLPLNINALVSSLLGFDVFNQQPQPFISSMLYNPPLFLVGQNHKRVFLAGSEGRLQMFSQYQKGAWQERARIIPQQFLSNAESVLWNSGRTAVLQGIDGALTAILSKPNGRNPCVNCAESLWLYTHYRRSASRIDHYEFSAEEVKWLGRIEAGNAGFERLGLSFSKPVGLMIKVNQQAKPALLFGGGYDTLYDNDAPALSIRPGKGNALFLVDAATRQLIWRAEWAEQFLQASGRTNHPQLLHAIPSSVAVLDSNNDAIADYAYVGDLAGQVWRIHLSACEEEVCQQASFTLDHIANFAKENIVGDRRFFHAPSVWRAQGKTFIAIASGNMEKPHDINVDNALFVFIDHKLPLLSDEVLQDVSLCGEQDCRFDNGWFFPLKKGEQAEVSPWFDGRYLWLRTVQTQPSNCEAMAEIYRLYRFSVEVDKVRQVDEVVVPSDSVFAKLDKNNSGLLQAMLEAYFKDLGIEQNLSAEEVGTAQKGNGIVIRYWRQKQH